MFNKKLLTAALTTAVVSGAGLSQVASADDFEISGNIALTSDYRFRGISQSDEDAAVQGGFDAEFSPGFYLGVWGSSVDFDTNGEGFDGSLELDYYGGWSSSIGDTDFGIDVGYIYYDYPGDDGDEGDYQEFYVGGSWKDFSIQVNYSDDYYGETGDFFYYAAGASFALGENFSLDLHVGYNDFEDTGFFATDEDAYTDWSVTLGYSVFGVDLSVAYVDTDLDEEDVFGTDWADATAVFTNRKSM
ncbi:MAG: TorF family putative porin [Pseudomonadota bacterium]